METEIQPKYRPQHSPVYLRTLARIAREVVRNPDAPKQAGGFTKEEAIKFLKEHEDL